MPVQVKPMIAEAFVRLSKQKNIDKITVKDLVGSVFAVVFATMLYATSKIRKENTVDALKNENL